MIWAIPFFWTVNHIVARKAPGVITPHVLAICRWALVGIFLAWLARVELKAHWDILRTQVWRYILLGALGMWVCGAGVYQAGISTKMVNISLIYTSSPVMIAVCSVLWLREPFSKRQALGVFIAILGVVHVVVQGEWARLAQVELVPGDLWILAASLAWAAYSLLQKHWRSTLKENYMHTVIGACPHDCPDTCSLITTVENGKAIRVQGNPNHPMTDGVLCTKVSRYTERTYHPDRILHPLKRIGPKGSGQFAPVSWDEALNDIAKRLGAIAAKDP